VSHGEASTLKRTSFSIVNDLQPGRWTRTDVAVNPAAAKDFRNVFVDELKVIQVSAP
jgi:hypothetical protein